DFFQNGQNKGFFLFKPIFTKNMVHPPFNHSALFGTIVGFSDFEKVIQNTRHHSELLGINIGIYDISEGTQELLYWSAASILKDPLNLSPQDNELQNQWTYEHIFKFGNRTWKLAATPTLKFIHQRYNIHWEVPIIGILISGLTASYFFVLANRRLLI